MLAAPAIALTAILLVMLCRGNPKRRRTARLRGESHSAMARRLLTAASTSDAITMITLKNSKNLPINISIAVNLSNYWKE